MAALDPAWVCLDPTDIPFQFVLRMGEGASISLYTGGRDTFDATIAGDLEALIDMLEGRADGDALFFARRLKITGNTETVVALRNTLDREEIDLRDEICAALGPFGDYLKA
jgi:predicted lipid carrier protein YhbT